MFNTAMSFMKMPMAGLQQMNRMMGANQSETSAKDRISSMFSQLEKMKPVVANLLRNSADPNKVMEAVYALGKRPGNALPLFFDPYAPLTNLAELRNKTTVFFLVLGVAEKLAIPKEGPLDLVALVDKAYALDDFEALWAVEGLGHVYGERFFERNIEPEGILSEEKQPHLRQKAMTMLNAGIGMAFADHHLKTADADTDQTEIRRLVKEIIRLCRTNATTGFEGAALESLGLITTNFHPALHDAVDLALLEDAPEVRPYFWHGTGRGSYFQFRNWIPYSLPSLFDAATHRANDEVALSNAFAGIARGILMVNIRAPEVLANLVIKATP